MNRLTKAWKALRGTLEPEVLERTKTEVDKVYLPEPAQWRNYYRSCIQPDRFGGAWDVAYYHSCAQAMEERPNGDVKLLIGFEINGNVYIAPSELKRIEVQPKPKRPKGKATA